MLSTFKVLRGDEKLAISKLLPNLKFASKIESDLRCVRCSALPIIKHYTSSCQHLYCSDCFNILRKEKNPECTLCQDKLDKIKLRKSDLEIERRIFSLKVYCSNKKHGCQESVTLAKILEHERNCPYPLITTVVNGNFHNTNETTQLGEAEKETVQRMHEGLSPIIKEKTAARLREEMLDRMNNWTENTDEKLLRRNKDLTESYQYLLEQVEQRLKQEMAAVEAKEIHSTFLQLKADFGHDLSNVEENFYTLNEKMIEQLAKQEEKIEKLKGEIDILSTIIRSQDAAPPKSKNENVNILLCGPSEHRSIFIQALVNYFTFDTSKSIDDGGLIQLNSIYTMKKPNGLPDVDSPVDQTELYQFPIDDSKWVRIISWEDPINFGQIKSPTIDSNYSVDEPTVYKTFELLENPLFAILENQFPQLNAIVFLINPSNSGHDTSYFNLLNYIDQHNFKQAVKYVFVNDEDKTVDKAAAFDYLSNNALIVEDHLKNSIDDNNVFWIDIQPYTLKTKHLKADIVEDKWQNSSVETRRLLSNISNDLQLSNNDISACTNVVQSMIATKEAFKNIHKLTSFYHESIIQIISNTDIANELKSDIEETDKRIEQLQFAWFNKDKQLDNARMQKTDLMAELKSTENVIQSHMEMLDTEVDNIANLIARITKYFNSYLIFKRSYLDDWLWRYTAGDVNEKHSAQNGGNWLSLFRQKSKNGNDFSEQSKLKIDELWLKLKTSVKQAVNKLHKSGDDDDGNFEEGLRIANQANRLLERIDSVANKV